MYSIIYIIFIVILIIYLRKYNYELFTNYKFIRFLHIPKNAGTSFKETYPNIQHTKHFNAFPLKNKINLAIIRNPYYRIKSIFSHIKDRSNNNTCKDLVEFTSLDQLAKAYYNKEDILHSKAHNLLFWDKSKLNLYKIYNKNGGCPKKINLPCIHWAPQYLYLNDLKNIDYLIRFENLDKEIDQLKLMPMFRKIFKKKIKHSRISSVKSKKMTYLTPTIIKLVNDIYKKDLILWNKVK